jgi:hypothetical protein
MVSFIDSKGVLRSFDMDLARTEWSRQLAGRHILFSLLPKRTPIHLSLTDMAGGRYRRLIEYELLFDLVFSA